MRIRFDGDGMTLTVDVERLPLVPWVVEDGAIVAFGLRFHSTRIDSAIEAATLEPKPARSKSEHQRLKATRRLTAPPVDEAEPDLPVYEQPGEDDVQ